ncbi:MAG TPA: indole-3-glycerol phosphate synthase TrpC [Polyangiaceae bacterium]|jgi:indole-3-glycerol phosphate synthase|nr:indole-3-glycerol phosphate synthase TrpC [Polyangiaceae bacterium]
MSVLGTIVASTRAHVAERRRTHPVEELYARLRDAPPVRSLHDAIAKGFCVVAEHKRRSPSGGASDATNLAAAYSTYAEVPWIAAVSVLTDEPYFGGSIDDLGVARERVGKPVLRKDFIVDDYQVVEARAYGADAILLMASVLASEPATMRRLYEHARALGLDVLVELGMTERRIEDLVQVVPPEARLWGVNARQFAKRGAASSTSNDATTSFSPGAKHDLPTDLAAHVDFRKLIPAGKLAVAESGIHHAPELAAARAAGYDAALIGTAFLGADRPIADVVDELGRVFR